jgi:hypothetical protein
MKGEFNKSWKRKINQSFEKKVFLNQIKNSVKNLLGRLNQMEDKIRQKV